MEIECAPRNEASSAGLRRLWRSGWVLSVAVIGFVLIDVDTRQLLADAWRQMLDISPQYLMLIIGFKIGQAIFSAMTWRNLLQAAYPERPLPLSLVIGIDQGQDAVNLVSPARAGTWAMLGAFRFMIPGARTPTLLTVWGVQALAYFIFSLVNYTLLAFFVPGATGNWGTMLQRSEQFATGYPWLVTPVLLALIPATVLLTRRLRAKVTEVRAQIRRGAAILVTPQRYLALVFAPSFGSLLCRAGTYAALLAAFDIPVTFWTIALATGARALAGAVRVTPGGVGTTQAIDVIALHEYAPAATVTAYSLSEAAITAVASFAIAAVALMVSRGFSGIGRMPHRRPYALLPRRSSSPDLS